MTSPQPECDLCGLALPSHAVEGAGGKRYCCQGCAHVASILEVVGEESEAGKRALDVARQRGLISSDPPPRANVVEIPKEALERCRLRVEGMACPSCGWLIESVLQDVDGVLHAHVDFLSDTVRIEFDLQRTSTEALTKAVTDAGYGLSSMEEKASGEERRDLYRLALSAVIAMNLMMFAFVGYDAFFTGISEGGIHLVNWVSMLLAIPVLTWCAFPIYRRALAALRCGRVVMETLLSLGIIAAGTLSAGAVLAGLEHIYLETATILVTLSLAGRVAERLLKRRSVRSLTELLRFAPSKARQAETGHFVALSEFSKGDLVRVERGETVPLDLIAAAEVTVRESLLTGEPHPIQRPEGHLVLAGSTVESDSLVGRVERTVGETVADSMRSRVEEALSRADAGSRLADRLAQGFVPLVVLVSIATFIGHLVWGPGIIGATMATVSVLVVACPCAFGIASSLALSLAVLRLARQGTLVKDPAALEKLRDVDTVVFDKTGTLTQGDLSLVRLVWVDDEDKPLIAGVRSLECNSRHPIAIALNRLLPDDVDVTVTNIIEVPGMGVTGQMGDRRIAVGHPDLFAPFENSGIEGVGGATRVWFGTAGEVPSAHIDLADTLRPEVSEVVNDLLASNHQVMLMSGDSPEATANAGRMAGIENAIGGLRPEMKSERVEALRMAGRGVAFIGDGFNDAEALAAADVGIALASGAELAMLSAPVVITRGDLRAVTSLLQIARKSMGILRGNFAWAFLYNVALLPVAAFGWLAPIHAAALMALSSISVGLNSLRVRAKAFDEGNMIEVKN